jgi:Spy/CpxP family protein refolding chaperone
MTTQLNPVRKDIGRREFTLGTALSVIGIATALMFAPLSASANPGHDGDKADHDSEKSCMDHEGMSADDHEKGHDGDAYDCDMDKDHDDGEDSDHQH